MVVMPTGKGPFRLFWFKPMNLQQVCASSAA